MYGLRGRLFYAAVEVERWVFLAALSRCAGGADVLSRVENVREIRVVDFGNDSFDVFSRARHAAVIVVV